MDRQSTIKFNHRTDFSVVKFNLTIGETVEDKTNKKSPNQTNQIDEKIEVCYMCHQEFNINEDDDSHYHYGEYPMCDYCSGFYGFYKKNR